MCGKGWTDHGSDIFLHPKYDIKLEVWSRKGGNDHQRFGFPQLWFKIFVGGDWGVEEEGLEFVYNGSKTRPCHATNGS